MEHVIVTPPVWTGYSLHHMYLPALVTHSRKTVVNLIEDICLSIKHNGFRKIVLLNGRAGNSALLVVAVNDFMARHHFSLVLVTYWDLLGEAVQTIRDSKVGGIGHACELETSIQLYLFPEHVGDKREANYIEWYGSEFLPQEAFFRPGQVTVGLAWERLTRGKGVFGDPSVATAEKGERFLTAAVTELQKVLRDLDAGLLGI